MKHLSPSIHRFLKVQFLGSEVVWRARGRRIAEVLKQILTSPQKNENKAMDSCIRAYLHPKTEEDAIDLLILRKTFVFQ